jgi:hypothetical protein
MVVAVLLMAMGAVDGDTFVECVCVEHVFLSVFFWVGGMGWWWWLALL